MKPIPQSQTDVLRAVHEHGPQLREIRQALRDSHGFSGENVSTRIRRLAKAGMVMMVRKPANDSDHWRVRLTQMGRDFAMVGE